MEEYGKLLFEEKSLNIIEACKEEEKNIKTLSQELGIPTKNLYYTVNKLCDAGLIKKTKTIKVKNLEEYYYSSSHIFNEGSINYDMEVIINNREEVYQAIMYQMKKSFEKLSEDLEKVKEVNNYEKQFSLTMNTKKMTFEEWEDLFKKVNNLIEEYPTDTSNDNNKYTFMFISYKN
ncbi:hypothetical protein [Macrococcoides caseolyticum]|uniref:Uncharacterized protein n=2 Tax=Macrococcoides caseolyticum TaxID=69966 RepID=A0ACC9MRJ9_9STAP|nr:hypothetical protein [Macrococcus caseolyticus]MDJ1110035.1 hypothetical protein [Macrococcus caseolyticus]PKE07289.1 hypothetical protein CW692_03230 [Macrococcus caseolyticus]PKE16917.1 hypothetical protein CW718_07355 [Macrococcus caseolyticus]PKE22544.1 hypothetical protein CW688_02375 [Macrococcus caseolyticus]PKE25182.1 hypothetical protein CW689_01570 [Macrococcus caseolyticus]